METKTLFKKGQTVFDSALFGDLKGEVIDDENGGYEYPVVVKFGDMELIYSEDGRLDKNFLPTLSNQPYKVEYVPPQPQIELPEVGQWCWFWNDGNEGYYYGKFMCLNPNQERYYQVESGMTFQYCSTTNPIENEKAK